MALTGYPPLDLVDNKSFIESQKFALDKICKETEHLDTYMVIGYIEKNTGPGKNLYNSAAVCHRGQIIRTYRKRLLPTYDVFDEARYFEPGKGMCLFTAYGKRVGVLICEDLWYENKLYTLNPMEELYQAKADCVISINASPSIVGKHDFRKKMVCDLSRKYSLPIAYVNQVGGNDDIIFDGNSFATDCYGNLIGHADRFHADRFDENIVCVDTECLPTRLDDQNFESDAEFFYEQAVFGIRDYVQKCGFKGVVIGESGGIDSAVVTALAVAALGPDKVVGITMPSQYSSMGSYADSGALCRNLGVTFKTIPIKDIFNKTLGEFNNVFVDGTPGLAEENMQARIRGLLLMTYSNRYGYLVLSTGNKSELSVGYCTLYGDMCGGLAPISDLYKMEVYAVAKYINRNKEIIPQAIIDKEPSAELAPGQKDTDSLPAYPILDSLLRLLIEGDLLSPAVWSECTKVALANPDSLLKVQKLLHRAEFKRRQGALPLKMHQKAFGQGRKMPVAQKWS
jgi:NAD+ synthetase